MSGRGEAIPKKSKEITRGQDVDIMKNISHSWEEMAKVHCAGRNQKVASIIAYCIVISRRQPKRLIGSYSAAEWQIGRDIETAYQIPPEWEQRIQASSLTKDERDLIASKFTTRQDAHHSPCEIKFDTRSLVSFLADPSQPHKPVDLLHVFALRGIFGAVDPLPAIFNESDSHAEVANLKKALMDACTTINLNGMALNRGTFEKTQKAAFSTWLKGADAGFDRALASNKKLRDAAKEGSYARLYRDAKITVLEYYRRFTASEIPLMGGKASFAFFDDLLN